MLTVIIKPHYYDAYTAEVVRITKHWIVVRCNDVAVQKYKRQDGYAAGAFMSRMSLAPNKIEKESLAAANAFADEHGGTWDSGWKPKKANRKSA